MLSDVYTASLHHSPNVRVRIYAVSLYIYGIGPEAAGVLVELEQG